MLRRLALLLCIATPALAQPAPEPAWPTRTVTIVVPYVPGGPSDILARVLAAQLPAAIGQNVVVENRTGANGAIAAQYVARQPADGHTLFVGPSGLLSITPIVNTRAGFDPERDFTPITIAITAPNLMVVNPAVPARSLPELIAWLRAQEGRASYGSSGIGSSEHLGMELFRLRTGVEVTHVPYPGGAAAVTDIVTGTLPFSSLNIATVAPHVQAGRLVAIAVGGTARHPLLPEVPTMAEAGLPGFTTGSWHSIVAPRGLSTALAARIHAAVTAALQRPESGERLAATGFQVQASSREALAALIRDDLAQWREVVRAAQVVVN
ncbi:Bug family tripartite tricarboxylate transporter substrate binding protein [Plastoroseomonas hellenica]|uniref:Bug family tripartite tricarboxylate transporter substrate binding protein n=1 Tax=Plastoroseomonas hellenica TaxID=2687306 RepID=UPI001BAD1812|nr:tripartite tricarboxylate transporter substrate binding protein [Plastoroseomonas hellenica]MBR0643820.1 tripartite tricarboxylate transporter substrate binding protein [Plastoroseomonas hellenica]